MISDAPIMRSPKIRWAPSRNAPIFKQQWLLVDVTPETEFTGKFHGRLLCSGLHFRRLPIFISSYKSIVHRRENSHDDAFIMASFQRRRRTIFLTMPPASMAADNNCGLRMQSLIAKLFEMVFSPRRIINDNFLLCDFDSGSATMRLPSWCCSIESTSRPIV